MTEQQILKKRGARIHPNSGAGSIKDDGSDEHERIEIKDTAKKQYILKVEDELEPLLVRASRECKQATFIVYFSGHNITAEITVRRGKG